MNRRSVIAAVATGFVSGCINPSNGSDRDLQPSNDTDSPNEGPDSEDDIESHEERGYERNAVLTARWVEFNPEDSGVDPYPTNQSPVADYDVLLELFDRTVEADEWKPPGTETRTAEPRLGDPVSETVSIERGEEIAADLRELNNKSDAQPPGRYFDHDETLVAFRIVFQE